MHGPPPRLAVSCCFSMFPYEKVALSIVFTVMFFFPSLFIMGILGFVDFVRFVEYRKRNKPGRWQELNPPEKHWFWGFDSPTFYPTLDLGLLRKYIRNEQDNDDPNIRYFKRGMQWLSKKQIIAFAITVSVEVVVILMLLQQYGFPQKIF